jgi:hypothetical protein
MTPRDLALGSLALLSVALVAVIVLELTAAPAPTPESAPPVRIGDLPAAVVDDVPSLVPTILARPLFSIDRRPKAAAASGNSGPTDDLPRLAGILINGPQKHAIFQPAGDAKPITAAEGDEVAGWRVQRITVADVTLDGPGGTRTLEPKFDPTLAAPAPAAGQIVPGAPQGPANPRQYLPGGMALPPGVPNPFAGQAVPAPGRPAIPQSPVRQQGGAPAVPNRR